VSPAFFTISADAPEFLAHLGRLCFPVDGV